VHAAAARIIGARDEDSDSVHAAGRVAVAHIVVVVAVPPGTLPDVVRRSRAPSRVSLVAEDLDRGRMRAPSRGSGTAGEDAESVVDVTVRGGAESRAASERAEAESISPQSRGTASEARFVGAGGDADSVRAGSVRSEEQGGKWAPDSVVASPMSLRAAIDVDGDSIGSSGPPRGHLAPPSFPDGDSDSIVSHAPDSHARTSPDSVRTGRVSVPPAVEGDADSVVASRQAQLSGVGGDADSVIGERSAESQKAPKADASEEEGSVRSAPPVRRSSIAAQRATDRRMSQSGAPPPDLSRRASLTGAPLDYGITEEGRVAPTRAAPAAASPGPAPTITLRRARAGVPPPSPARARALPPVAAAPIMRDIAASPARPLAAVPARGAAVLSPARVVAAAPPVRGIADSVARLVPVAAPAPVRSSTATPLRSAAVTVARGAVRSATATPLRVATVLRAVVTPERSAGATLVQGTSVAPTSQGTAVLGIAAASAGLQSRVPTLIASVPTLGGTMVALTEAAAPVLMPGERPAPAILPRPDLLSPSAFSRGSRPLSELSPVSTFNSPSDEARASPVPDATPSPTGTASTAQPRPAEARLQVQGVRVLEIKARRRRRVGPSTLDALEAALEGHGPRPTPGRQQYVPAPLSVQGSLPSLPSGVYTVTLERAFAPTPSPGT